MPYPSHVKGLQRFLGMINYFSKVYTKFINSYRTTGKLLEKDSMWSFENIHRQEIYILKHLVTKLPALKLFDSKLPTKNLM